MNFLKEYNISGNVCPLNLGFRESDILHESSATKFLLMIEQIEACDFELVMLGPRQKCELAWFIYNSLVLNCNGHTFEEVQNGKH